MLLQSEKAEDLKLGLVILTSTLRKPGPISVTVDNSPGFVSLINNKDRDFQRLMINLLKTDEMNKNANAVIDRGCQELEQELKKLEPEGTPISNFTLKLAIMKLNSKLRRRGNISAYELHTSRDQTTGANLHLDDNSLRCDQLSLRNHNQQQMNESPILVGDTVTIKNKVDKHKAKDVFLVTDQAGDRIDMQKIAHTLSKEPTKLMSKIYKTRRKYVVPMQKSQFKDVSTTDHFEDDSPSPIKEHSKAYVQWSPINIQFYEKDDSDDEDVDTIQIKSEANNINVATEFESANEELAWDDSPHQYELSVTDNNPNLDLAEAYHDSSIYYETDTDATSISSHDEVFMNPSPVLPKSPKLKRKNAMRLKINLTEPRVTRI